MSRSLVVIYNVLPSNLLLAVFTDSIAAGASSLLIRKFFIDARYQFSFAGSKSVLESGGKTIGFKSSPALLTLSTGYSFL